MIANQGDDGAKTPVLFSMLSVACRFDEDGHAYKKDQGPGGMLRGVRRYRPRLEALGIKGVMLNPSNCSTWDQLETTLLKGERDTLTEHADTSGQP
jgi:hypothetical protein